MGNKAIANFIRSMPSGEAKLKLEDIYCESSLVKDKRVYHIALWVEVNKKGLPVFDRLCRALLAYRELGYKVHLVLPTNKVLTDKFGDSQSSAVAYLHRQIKKNFAWHLEGVCSSIEVFTPVDNSGKYRALPSFVQDYGKVTRKKGKNWTVMERIPKNTPFITYDIKEDGL